jgi:DNA-binding NtrC family response regulator/predicted ATPase
MTCTADGTVAIGGGGASLTAGTTQRTMAGAMGFLEELVGDSPGIADVRDRIRRLVARASDVRRLPPVLIYGETGTGKGLLARALHQAGPRAQGPFVDVNCAAIPETLLEAEMFGFERGAFTDARQAKRGLFQTANRGTLFLDEIGLLPEALQAKLLTALEERAVRRLGATRSEPVDVWVIAATNADLPAAIRAGRFREDLYHRLAVLTLMLPPLRERGRDILLLAEHFLARACAEYGLPAKRLAPGAREALAAYAWPGNVRELANAMERAALLSDAAVVTPDLLALPGAPARSAVEAAAAPAPPSLAEAVDSTERAHLLDALETAGWNVTRAAARLGISRNTIRYRIEKHGLRPGGPAPPRRNQPRSAPPAPPAPPPAPASPGGSAPASVRWERRRLTLLRAVLEGAGTAVATAGAGRALEICVDKIHAFGGRVEDVSPTALLGVFGLEPAEDAPRRAALAAIAVRRALQRAPAGEPETDVGLAIHVGPFMIARVGDASKIDQGSLRDGLAALDALLGEADPGVTYVSAATVPFLARRFDLTASPRTDERGVRVFQLGGIERRVAAPGRASRFVGRLDDLQLLRSRLASAARGHGQIVAIAGEAGIGKSRLLAEFREGIAAQSVLQFEGACLPYGASVPYQGLLDLVRAMLRLGEADPPDVVSAKVADALAEVGMPVSDALPYVLQLLGVGHDGEQVLASGPEAARARTFEVLRDLVTRMARNAPVVLVLEDLHWIDRTSEEFLGTLADDLAGARVLLVTTHRPGYRPPWLDRSYATQMALQPLGPEDSRALVRAVFGSQPVADAVVERILEKTEGNPFFLEEVARAMRDRPDAAPRVVVPDTVEELLLARIDHLAVEDKAVLQCAAVVGRNVPTRLLQSLVDLTVDTLRGALARLQGAEFLYENRLGASPEYIFRHALVQDAAYGSLLPAQRRSLHARIVEVLEAEFPEIVGNSPELLAHHCSEAGLPDRAARYRLEAGRRASERSASVEAIAHLDAGLALAAALPDTSERRHQELSLRIALGPVLINARGPLTPEVARNYARALDLCAELPESPLHFAALWGAWRISPNFHTKLQRATELLAVAERLADPDRRLQAHHCLWATHFHLAQHETCCEHVAQGLRIYEAGDYRAHGAVYGGHDPKVCGVGERAFALWLLGFPEQALAANREALGWARTLGHAGTLVHALDMSLLLHRYLRDPLTIRHQAEELVAYSEEHGFPVHRAKGLAFQGAAFAAFGQVERGVELMRQGLEAQEATATHEDFPVLHDMLAAAYAEAGRPALGLQTLDRALRETEASGLAYWSAELHRRRGEVLLRLAPEQPAEARDCFERAMAIAQAQDARALELRAAMSLARLERATGRAGTGHERLARLYAGFSEGFGTPDLSEARELLDELASPRSGPLAPDPSPAP